MGLPKSFWLLWFGQTLGRIGILAPAFLVLYLQEGKLTDAHTTPIIVGLFGAGVVASGLIGGVLADMIGPRRTIILAQPVAVLAALLFTQVTNVYLISLLCLVAGFLSAVDRPAGAGLIAKLVPREQFSRAYSLFLVGFNVGMSLGPVAAGFLLALYPPALFIMWAVCSVVYAALISVLPADEARSTRPEDGTTMFRYVVREVAEPFRSRVLLVFLLLTFLLACIYLQVNSALPLDMRAGGLGPEKIGIVLAINAVLAVVLLPLVPRVVKGMRDATPLVLASVLVAVGFGMTALAHGLPLFVAAVVVWTLGEVLWAPMSTTFLAKRAPAGRTSTYQGAYFFAWNVAFIVGGPAGIAVGNTLGYGTVWIGTLVIGLGVALGFKLMTKARDYDSVTKTEIETETESERLGER
jgi:MFS family permease